MAVVEHIFTHKSTQITNSEEYGSCPVLRIITLHFFATEENMEKVSQGRRRETVGTMNTEYAEQNIHNHKNT